MGSLFSKATQPSDFIKPNVIRKLAYKVKYIGQINGGLIMFFRKFENSWLDCEKYGMNQYKKKEQQSTVQCSKCYDSFHII